MKYDNRHTLNIRDMKLIVEVERDPDGLIEEISIIEAWKELDADPLQSNSDLLREIAQEIDELMQDEIDCLNETINDDRGQL